LKTTIIASAASLMVLGAILITEAFRSPLTFYSMFDFGVFSLIAGLCLPFASEVERIVESEWKAGTTPMPRPLMAVKQKED